MSELDRTCITIHGGHWLTGLIGWMILVGGVLFWPLFVLALVYAVST